MYAKDNLAVWRRPTLAATVALLVAACTTTTSPPPASETASSPSAATSPRELPIDFESDLTPGSYFLSDFPVGITFEIPTFESPATSFSCSPSPVEQAVCYSSTGGEFGIVTLTFQIVENVVTDPCQDQETAELLDPPVGPSVDDLVAAISNLEGFEATPPVDVSVSGFDGKEFTLTAPATDGCGATWATANRTTGMGEGEINLIRILDVDGERVVIVGAYKAATPDEAKAVLDSLMDSVEIEA